MKKVLPFIFLLIACCTPAGKKKDDTLLNIPLKDQHGKSFPLETLIPSRVTVFIFLSPECLICQGYSITLHDLWTRFNNTQINFAGVIPGNDYTVSEVDSFAKAYNIPFPFYFDEKKELTHYLRATVTPQCFVIDKNGKTLYTGKIDDYAVAPGVTKKQVTQHYLRDALTSVLMNGKIETAQTEPAGCFIEK